MGAPHTLHKEHTWYRRRSRNRVAIRRSHAGARKRVGGDAAWRSAEQRGHGIFRVWGAVRCRRGGNYNPAQFPIIEDGSGKRWRSPSIGRADGVDKSVLSIAEPRRYRNKEHLRFVVQQPCLVCGRTPSDPHHLRFMQPRALGRKVSDEFVAPLCRTHHREVHRVGDERAWWKQAGINPIKVTHQLSGKRRA